MKAGPEAGAGWGAVGPEPGKPELGAPRPPPAQARGKEAGGKRAQSCAGLTGGGRPEPYPGRCGLEDTRTPMAGEVTRRAGVKAVPAPPRAAPDTSGLESSIRYPTVRAAVPMRARRALGSPALQSSPPPGRPRRPALALPLVSPGSLGHFSFSDEDTCWRSPGRSLRWVARGQSPPFPPEGSGGVGGGAQPALGSLQSGFQRLPGAPTPSPVSKRLGASEGFLQVVALKTGTGSCPLSAHSRWDPFTLFVPLNLDFWHSPWQQV